MNFDFKIITDSFPVLLIGATVTVKITAISVALGTIIGLVVSISRLSSIFILKMLSRVYIDFIRGTPLLVQIFLIYFALPVLTTLF